VRRIRPRARRAHLLVGLWGHGGNDFSPAEITAATAADAVVTTLRDAIAEIEAAVGAGQPRTEKLPEPLARQPA
jgi:hypothetical protein